MKKRLVLKKKYRKALKIIIAILIILLFIAILNIEIKNYIEWLRKCDEIKGYTCNIFGK